MSCRKANGDPRGENTPFLGGERDIEICPGKFKKGRAFVLGGPGEAGCSDFIRSAGAVLFDIRYTGQWEKAVKSTPLTAGTGGHSLTEKRNGPVQKKEKGF